MSAAKSSQEWHNDQKQKAVEYKPKQFDIPGDYEGGGPSTGTDAAPPPPAGTEKFTGMPLPTEYWIIVGSLTTAFLAITLYHRFKQS